MGPSIRLAAVYKDIEDLPISDNNNHLWINDFYKICNQCVKKCMASAIFEEAVVLDDGSKQCIDYKKCEIPFSQNKGGMV
ncbi:MAG: hypothetical protein JJE21_02780 [Spirochaetaceae bacterium]|nr:hypothetical protein [Spirochaetaceae bacterium]